MALRLTPGLRAAIGDDRAGLRVMAAGVALRLNA
jgi:hypothetical protein